MKLYFVRHGETEWNVKKKIQGKTDIPLNENGIRQAKELACQLVEEDISVKHVYHSPQLRAAETARIAAEALHATCIPLDGLVEMNLGSWEGSNWRVIERENSPEYQEWRKDRRYVRTPGGGGKTHAGCYGIYYETGKRRCADRDAQRDHYGTAVLHCRASI